MSLHSQIHLSLCLLHEGRQKASGKPLSDSMGRGDVKPKQPMDVLSLQFEYQQAQLEVEIENLSWKVERAETTDVGELRQQMNSAEVMRLTLLRDFIS